MDKQMHSFYDRDGRLWVACAECLRGGNGDESCGGGWRIKRFKGEGCFAGELLDKKEDMKNDRCKTLEDVQESLRAAVDDLGSDDVFDRVHALIYMNAVVKRLLSQFKRNYSGELAREVDEMCEAVEEYFND